MSNCKEKMASSIREFLDSPQMTELEFRLGELWGYTRVGVERRANGLHGWIQSFEPGRGPTFPDNPVDARRYFDAPTVEELVAQLTADKAVSARSTTIVATFRCAEFAKFEHPEPNRRWSRRRGDEQVSTFISDSLSRAFAELHRHNGTRLYCYFRIADKDGYLIANIGVRTGYEFKDRNVWPWVEKRKDVTDEDALIAKLSRYFARQHQGLVSMTMSLNIS